jgi:hypothetical protein
MTNYMTDIQADSVIDSLQKTFAKRRVAKSVINEKKYNLILSLKIDELGYCISHIEQLSKSDRVNFLTNIVDFFSDKELRNNNLKTIFSKFRDDLECIV